MGKCLAAAAAVVLLSAVPASATTFLYTGALDSYQVETSGVYAFTVAGAQGGNNSFRPTDLNLSGGGGAILSGDIYLDAGEDLSILVGGGGYEQGGDGGSGGSGGGMSFIALGSTPLIVAGGGGGSNFFNGDGAGALTGTGGGGPNGGADGQGATGEGAGAGWFSDGNVGPSPSPAEAQGGDSGPDWAGGQGYPGDFPFYPGSGASGGFGGGGGGSYSNGGGGGGYSGGSAGSGGGSYIDPTAFDITAIAGGNAVLQFNSGVDGYIDLDLLSSVPEPATWAMFLAGFGAVGFAMRRPVIRVRAHDSQHRAG